MAGMAETREMSGIDGTSGMGRMRGASGTSGMQDLQGTCRVAAPGQRVKGQRVRVPGLGRIWGQVQGPAAQQRGSLLHPALRWLVSERGTTLRGTGSAMQTRAGTGIGIGTGTGVLDVGQRGIRLAVRLYWVRGAVLQVCLPVLRPGTGTGTGSGSAVQWGEVEHMPIRGACHLRPTSPFLWGRCRGGAACSRRGTRQIGTGLSWALLRLACRLLPCCPPCSSNSRRWCCRWAVVSATRGG